MRAVARAPGTCGELIQGTVKDVNFHVTCPINLYSVAQADLSWDIKGVTVSGGREKAAVAVEKLLSSLGRDNLGAHIEIHSDLPQGKGMASSTADITSACTAVAQALDQRVAAEEIARIALSIEPTDGLMFPGLVVFDHVRGLMNKPVEGIPEVNLCIVDTGGIVDTGEFNARVNLKLLNRLNEPKTNSALHALKQSLKTNNLKEFGGSCTASAVANQDILEKPDLKVLQEICLAFGGLGVNAAHSGTVVGMLFPLQVQIDWFSIIEAVREKTGKNAMGPVRLIGGGPEIWDNREGQGKWIPYYMSTEVISGQQRQSME